MALVLGSFLAARTERWWLAGLIGGLAALTRINGLVLLLALPVEAATQWFTTPPQDRRWRWEWLAIGLVGIGFAIYLGLNLAIYGTPFQFLIVQHDHWFKSLAAPWDAINAALGWFGSDQPDEVLMYGGMELLFVVIGLIGTIYAAFRFRPSWFAWMAGNLVLFVSTSFLLSTPRYVLTLFPLFVALALATRRTWAAGRGLRHLAGGLRVLRRPLRHRGLGLLTVGRMAALAVPALVAVVVLGGCGAPSGSPVDLPDGSAARRWGDGPYGLVLVHDQGLDAASWATQAATFAGKGMTVVAVESATPDAAVAALRSLLEDAGLDRVALLGAGDGAGVALQAALDEPDLVDQLVVISASGDAAALDVFPKLFVASEGEPAAGDAERMADESRGDWNALFLAPGEASGQALLSDETGGEPAMEAIVARLEERR